MTAPGRSSASARTAPGAPTVSPGAVAPSAPAPALTAALLVLAMLAAAVTRAWLALSGAVDGLLLGAAYGSMWLALALAAGWRPRLDGLRGTGLGLGLGVGGGLLLVAVSIAFRHPGPLLVAHAAPFGAWAAVTVVVAVGEELVLRGVFMDALIGSAGPLGAALLAAIVFALVHVPLDGWPAVPLDLGAGLFLGGLRLAGRGVTAPVAAHVVADLATWWL